MSQRTDVETDNPRGGGGGDRAGKPQKWRRAEKSGTTPKTTGVPDPFGFIWGPRDIFYCFRAFQNSAFRLQARWHQGREGLRRWEIFYILPRK